MNYSDQDLKSFIHTLKKRFQDLRPWAASNSNEAWRVLDASQATLPLTVDIYGNRLVITEYQVPGKILGPEDFESAADSAARALAFPRNRVFLKSREKLEEGRQYTKEGSDQEE